jgi:electron transfer flavoprotein beta subunit
MKLLVCVSQVPDTTTKIVFANGDTELDKKGVQFILNPYDEWYALVRALELKEQVGTGKVTLFHVGPAENEASIRKGLAIGADDAIRVDADPKSASFVAQQIAAHAKQEGYDAIFFGKETIDYNGAEIPAMVAELLDLPFVSNASQMSVAGKVATLSRDIEGGKEVLEVDFPFVLSCAKGIAEQRIPNMQGIMRSKAKPLAKIAAVAAEDQSVVVKYEYPAQKTGVKLIDPNNMDELVHLLHNEAKVL